MPYIWSLGTWDAYNLQRLQAHGVCGREGERESVVLPSCGRRGGGCGDDEAAARRPLPFSVVTRRGDGGLVEDIASSTRLNMR